jgi:hypothetical protein
MRLQRLDRYAQFGKVVHVRVFVVWAAA